MTLRTVLSWELMAALSILLGTVGSAAAAGPVAPSTGSLRVSHEPVGCMIADESPQIEATVAPSSNVAEVRVYFRSVLSQDLYYIVAERQGDLYVAGLPRPQLNAGPVTFYVEAASRDGVLARSAEGIASVVPNALACPAGLRPAPIDPTTTTQLTIFSESGATAPAAGFTGISSVLTGTALAAVGVAGAVAGTVGGAAAAGGILGMSTAVAVATAAVAVGVGTAVVAQGPNNSGRFPPGRPCTLDPRPGCQPSPSR